MRIDWWTLALQLVNFAILVWLLQRFLWRPVVRLVDARRADIDARFEAARAAEARAKTQQDAVASERAGMAGERQAIIAAAERQAEEAATARLQRAEREAAEFLDGARKSLAKEREAALAEAQHAAVDLGAEIARRLIDELPMPLRAEAWLERIETALAALPAAERDRLVRDCADGGQVRIVTASALPADVASAWQTRLSERLGDRIAVAFQTDPALIAGVELHLPHAVLHFSWQSALQSIRSEMAPHGDAR